jgi:hypothetical protein
MKWVVVRLDGYCVIVQSSPWLLLIRIVEKMVALFEIASRLQPTAAGMSAGSCPVAV